MKCSSCGREFGSGVNCQYCGVDRVTGLGNYSGYHNLEGDINYSSYDGMSSSPKTMVCFACGEIIPANSEFCPYCSKQLYVTCPKCGNTYSSQFPACNKCGTNRESYHKQQEAERQRAIREEEERQRQQREWEQSLDGKAETSSSSGLCFFKLIGAISLIVGISLLVITITEQGSENFGIRKALEGYGIAIATIIMGGSFLLLENKD